MKETIGDSYNIVCSHCGKNNHYVCQGIKVVLGKITTFAKDCFHCEKKVYYHATYEISVRAFQLDPIEELKRHG